ncbi:MAG TPA: aldo/keto reductase [Thermomicrobiales bacterium]|nr:aldo/keto reductase [Thermomicrobiales bacterium]
MEYRRLGGSGLKVSAIGLGGNTFGRYVDEAGTARVIHRALDLGVNFFDTADTYGHGVSEEFVGKALRDRRDRAVIGTKLGMKWGEGPHDTGLSRQRVMDGVEGSLRRLGTDYIDLLQVHRWDPETPLEESLRALDDLVGAGKLRYIGCSNFAAWQLVQSLWVSDRRGYASFVSVQPRYSLLDRSVERELLPACRAFDVGIIPYSPLAGGILTGKYRGGARPAGARGSDQPGFFERQLAGHDEDVVDRLASWAEGRGHQLGELAIAWLLGHPEVSTVIAGVTSPEQVETNVRAAEWRLTPEEVAETAEIAG